MKATKIDVKNILTRDFNLNVNLDGGMQLNKPVVFGNQEFSIQCSEGHVCSPRKTTFISDYTTMEVGVFLNELNKKVQDYIRKEILDNHFLAQHKGYFMLGNVPVEKINKMLEIASN